MKESTGGALLMGLAAGIIMIFIILVAFFISYGKSFRIKNALINKIEQSEGMLVETLNPGDNTIKNFLNDASNKYNGRKAQVCYNEFKNYELVEGVYQEVFSGFSFEVIIYMEMDRTILGETFNPKIPIKGETKVIQKGNFWNTLKSGSSISNWPVNCSSGYTEITL